MDLASLRGLAVDLNFAWHGVDVTVTPNNEDLIQTRGIWLTDTGFGPAGASLQGLTPRRTLALPKADVPRIQVGATIQAPERTAGTIYVWRVETIEQSEPEQQRVGLAKHGPAT